MSTEKSNQSGAKSDGFVADGPANFAEGIRPEIQGQVEEEFSERLAKASWLAAFRIRAEMRHEVERRISEQMPPDATLW